jgi:hypothetical protein
MAALVVAIVVPFADSSAQQVSGARSLPPIGARRTGDAPVFVNSPNYFGNFLRGKKDTTARATAWSVLASAVVPGTGQAWLGQDRFVAYLAVEAYAWARYAADARDGRQARTAYRNLASEVARRPFSAVRPVGDFDYYERMEKFAESGAFDAIPGGDLDPEPDSSTANGAIWLLARQTYWTNPSAPPSRDSDEYKFAETFYRERAIGPEYRWSWNNARLEYAEYRRTIRRSNNAYRSSLEDLGLVIANHALSTVDAFITVRLRRRADADGQRFELSGSLPLGRLR